MSTRTALLALSAWLAGLAAAGTGHAVAATSASIITVNDKSVLSISAAAGESNDITISETLPLSPDVKRLAVSDAADTVTPGPGCVAVEGDEVRCRYEGVAAIWVDAGDLDDAVTKWTPITGWLRGGAGDDTLRGGPANDANYLDGETGDDMVIGGPQRDELDGGPGADVLDGGGGSADRASYAIRTGRVEVTLDDLANDGAAASFCLAGGGSCGTYTFERDNVRSTVEYVTGGSGNDTLTGHAGANSLAGGPGADTLNGLGGNDTLRGDQGNEVYNGGDGRDTLVSTVEDGADVFNGGPGAWDRVTYAGRTAPVVVDVDGDDDDGANGEADNVKTDVEQVAGGNGDDRLTGNADPDVLFGGPGSDELFGLGGIDLLVGEHDATVAQVGDGSPGDDVLHGGADADSLDGGPGDDTLNGEGNDDRLAGGSGGDVFQGGDGRDSPTTARGRPGSASRSTTPPATARPARATTFGRTWRISSADRATTSSRAPT